MISKHTTGVTDEEINHRADKFSISSSGLSYREKLPESHDHTRISVKTYYVEHPYARNHTRPYRTLTRVSCSCSELSECLGPAEWQTREATTEGERI